MGCFLFFAIGAGYSESCGCLSSGTAVARDQSPDKLDDLSMKVSDDRDEADRILAFPYVVEAIDAERRKTQEARDERDVLEKDLEGWRENHDRLKRTLTLTRFAWWAKEALADKPRTACGATVRYI